MTTKASTAPLRIAVDARVIGSPGMGTYLRSVVPRVMALLGESARWTLVGPAERLHEHGWVGAANVAVAPVGAPLYGAREQWEVWRAAARARAELLWAPHYNVPVAWGGKLLVTVHDVFHLAMRQIVRRADQRLYARVMFEAVRRRADAIVFVSEFSRAEFARHVGAARGQTAVVHNGVAPSWFHVESGRRPHVRPYLLFVGDVKPHKNLVRLVEAFERVAAAVPHDLLVVGKRDGMRTPDREVERAAARLGGRVVLTGAIPQNVLEQMVTHADALVHPSLYEGFGLTPLEAMAAGCPVLVARAASLPEVCGDAALYCDPLDAEDMARQIRRVLLDDTLRAVLRERGRRRAALFSWDAAASATARVLLETAGRRR